MSTMKTVTTREAQHHFSKVMEMVEAGEEVVITRRGKKVARLEAYKNSADFDKKIDWKAAIADIEKNLGHLPKQKGSTIEMMRRDERY